MQRVNTVLHGESLTDASATKFCNSTQMFCLQFQKRNVGFWKCVVREFQVSYTLLLPHFDLFSRISGFLGKRPHFIESPFYREKLASEKVLRSPFYRIPILSRTYCSFVTLTIKGLIPEIESDMIERDHLSASV